MLVVNHYVISTSCSGEMKVCEAGGNLFQEHMGGKVLQDGILKVHPKHLLCLSVNADSCILILHHFC